MRLIGIILPYGEGGHKQKGCRKKRVKFYACKKGEPFGKGI